jgi:uncharacterized protein (TIGR03083 family)
MDRDRYQESLRGDGVALGTLAEGNLGRPVPSCPGWSVADLVRHVGGVHRFWGQIVGRQLLDPEDVDEIDDPGDADLLGWYDGCLADLLEALHSTDPDTPVWSWASEDPVPALWVDRRMAQETAVHRWDGQDALGPAEPIATDIAVDGIEEYLYQFVGANPATLADGAETVRFEASDTGDAWVARVAHGVLDVRPAGRASSLVPVEATARGSASNLLLLLWRRRRLDTLDVDGDPAAIARFLIRADLD